MDQHQEYLKLPHLDEQLLAAAKISDAKEMSRLLEAKANVDAYYHYIGGYRQTSKRSETALILSAKQGYIDAVDVLLAAKADTEHECSPAKALDFAIANGHELVVKALLAANASRFKPGLDGETPVHIAVRHGRDNILDLLLTSTGSAPISPDCRDRGGARPLDLAISLGNCPAVSKLIAAKASTETTDTWASISVLSRAVMTNSPVMVAQILKEVANGDATLNAALCRAEKLPGEEGGSVIRLLLEAKADPNVLAEFEGFDARLDLGLSTAQRVIVFGLSPIVKNTKYGNQVGHFKKAIAMVKEGKLDKPSSEQIKSYIEANKAKLLGSAHDYLDTSPDSYFQQRAFPFSCLMSALKAESSAPEQSSFYTQLAHEFLHEDELQDPQPVLTKLKTGNMVVLSIGRYMRDYPGYCCGAKVIHPLTVALQTNTSLRELHFEKVEVNAEDIAHMLLRNQDLTCLSFSSCQINGGWKPIFRVLENNRSLTRLYICSQKLTYDDMESISRVLVKNTALDLLSLEGGHDDMAPMDLNKVLPLLSACLPRSHLRCLKLPEMQDKGHLGRFDLYNDSRMEALASKLYRPFVTAVQKSKLVCLKYNVSLSHQADEEITAALAANAGKQEHKPAPSKPVTLATERTAGHHRPGPPSSLSGPAKAELASSSRLHRPSTTASSSSSSQSQAQAQEQEPPCLLM